MPDLHVEIEDVFGVVALALMFVAGVWLAYGVGMPMAEVL